jgi:hypothetical protein
MNTNTYTDSVHEYADVLADCRSAVDGEDWSAAEKDACARRMTEAWYRGRMDAERIARRNERRMAVAA